MKKLFIIIFAFASFLPNLSYGDTTTSQDYLYRIHLYYDNGRLLADRDFQYKYDVIPQKFDPQNFSTQFPYKAEVVNLKGDVATTILFDPKNGDPNLMQGKISVDAPFLPDGKQINFFNNNGDQILTIFVNQSSYCNDDGVCNPDAGETNSTCPNDCKPTPSPSVAPASSGGIAKFLVPIIYLIFGIVIVGGWIFWKKRSGSLPPAV